ncbi:hypothetical protein KBA63_04495 [Candidatus Woesebacteria bacterium]|nr:hypothetical protein [Candidatus Woesebacteria bacterium]MBP9687240.1 hypothetical protein [Candidatus Woesebacteria bacterium]
MVWNPNFAYAIGLLVADGNLSKDNRHIDLTSKDLSQIVTFASILSLNNKIGRKRVKGYDNNLYYRIQFGNKTFYDFLVKIGLSPRKSTTIGEIKVPNKYFADYLRGYFDGDGCTYSYFDPRWKNSFLLYMSFTSGSAKYLVWLNNSIYKKYHILGRINHLAKTGYQLRFGKKSTLILISKMYYKEGLPCLSRKYSKIVQSLGIIQTQAGVSKLVYEHA